MKTSINIIDCVETVDNWGGQEKYSTQETFRLLSNPEEWTDDQIFRGPAYERYLIDDLIGKTVTVGQVTFTVQDM
jgi:hypothetical protein